MIIKDTYYIDANLEKEKAQEIISALKENLLNSNKIYLCSNEIGYAEKAFALKAGDDAIVYFGPVFTDKGATTLVKFEDHDIKYIAPRYKNLTINYLNNDLEERSNTFSGAAAVMVNCAMDLLEGVQISDFGLEITAEFEAASEEEQQEVVNAYIEQLCGYQKILEEEIKSDEELNKYWQNIKFNEAVKNGEIEFDDTSEKNLNRKQRRFFERITKKLNKRGKKK